MEENYKANIIDILEAKWGRAPVPLIPRSLRVTWQNEALPAWLVSEAHLPTGSTIAALGPLFWEFTSKAGARVLHFARFFFDARLASLRPTKCFDRPWPTGLPIHSIPFSARSRRLLKKHGYIDNPRLIADLRFGDLLDIPGLGVKSILEITTLVETAMDIHDEISSSLSQSATLSAGDETNPRGKDESTAALLSVLEEPWVDLVSDQDPRFAALLPPGRGTLQDRIDRCIADPNSGALETPALVRRIEDIRQVVSRIESQPLETSLRDFLAALLQTTDQRRIDAIAMRFGWTGAAPKTLQECGDMLGITRERIRQIEAKATRRLPKHTAFMPTLDQALNLLEQCAPLALDEAARLLERNQITRKPFSPISLLETAKLLGHETPLSIQQLRGIDVVVATQDADGLGDVVRMARKLAGQAGVASVFQVSDALSSLNESGTPQEAMNQAKEEDIRRFLSKISKCEFLNDDWFWFTDIPEGRNRLCNITNRILSVASPQSIIGVREGIRRAFRFRSLSQSRYRSLTVPPIAVMERFFRCHPEYRVDEDHVEPVKLLDYHQLLGETEQTFVEVFRSFPSGVLDRKAMMDACVARGINENTFMMYTSYSPVLEHVGIDMWKLRGVHVDPAAIEALKEQNQLRFRETRLLEYGWTSNGKLWVAWKIPPNLGSVVLGVPGAVRRYLTGRSFSACAKETGRQCGSVSINEQGSSYGYTAFLRYAGADAGDVLRTEFDLARNEVELTITDENILEQN